MSEKEKDQDQKLRQLMTNAQNGDKKSYESLLREVSKIVGAFLAKRIHSPQAAEDITQEILISIHRAMHTYDPDMPFSPWMFSIARHKMIDYFRKQGRLSKNEVTDDETALMLAAAEVHFDPLEKERIRVAVSNLPKKQMQVVDLLKLEEFTVKEVAVKLDMTESAVKVSAHRAYKALRQMLEDCYS